MNKYLKVGQTTSGRSWLLILTGLLAAGCVSTRRTGASSSPAPAECNPGKIANSDGDRFAIGDLVSVAFSGAKGMIPSHQERIKNDGTITLFLVGAVKAEGKTPGELVKEIHDHYVPRYYKRLTVTLDGGQNVYYVDGQVNSPGRLWYLGPTTVTKVIQSAGGLTDLAAKHRVELIRASGEKVEVNWIKATSTPGGSLDPRVFPGDRIVVPKRSSWDVFQQ